MHLYVAIHHPRPEHLEDLLGSMERFGRVLSESPGLVRVEVWQEQGGDRVVATSLWESKDAWQAAVPRMGAFLADVPLDVREERPRELFSLVPVRVGP